MREDTLRESLASGLLTEFGSETERFSDRQMGLDGGKRGTISLDFFDDLTSLLVHDLVDSSNTSLRALNFDQEDWFEQSRLSSQLASVKVSSSGWDKLTSSSMDGISVKGDIVDVDSDSSPVFSHQETFAGNPLEGSVKGIFDFVQVLDSLGDINQKIGTVGVRTEDPDLSGFIRVPAKVIRQDLSSGLRVVSRLNLETFDGLRKTFFERNSLGEKSVVTVGGLGQAHSVGFGGDSFSVRNDRRRDDQFGTSHEIFLEILHADFQVQFSGSGDNVFLGVFIHRDLDERIRLGKSLKTFSKLGDIVGLGWLDSNSDDSRDRELHGDDWVGVFGFFVSEGSVLDEDRVNSDNGDSVSGWDRVDRFGSSTHHDDGSLDVLDEKIFLLSVFIVRPHDSNLVARLDGSGEDSTESVESTLVRSWDHLGDVDQKRTVSVALSHGFGGLVISWTRVQKFGSVGLGLTRRWEMIHSHLKNGSISWEPLLHDRLEERLLDLLSIFSSEVEADSLEELVNGVMVILHGGSEDLFDRVKDELAERSSELGSSGRGVLRGPLLSFLIKEHISPQSGLHLLDINLEFGGVHLSELAESEGPSLETGSKSNVSSVREDSEIFSHNWVLVGGNDDVGVFNDSDKVEVHVFRFQLKFKETSIELVDDQDWDNSFTKSLSEHSFSLHTDSFNDIDDNKSSVSDSKGSSDFGREIDVAGRIDQVDQESISISLWWGFVFLWVFEVKRDTSGFDGNTSFLFVLSGISQSDVSGIFDGNNTGSSD